MTGYQQATMSEELVMHMKHAEEKFFFDEDSRNYQK